MEEKLVNYQKEIMGLRSKNERTSRFVTPNGAVNSVQTAQLVPQTDY